MFSFRLGLRVAGASFAGMLALAGCDNGDDDTGSDTMAGSAGDTMMDTGMSDTMMTSADSTSGGSGTDLTHMDDILPIWTASCALNTGCHAVGTSFPPELSPEGAYAAIVNVPSLPAGVSLDLVEPGSAEDSYLWHKINNTYLDVGGTGSPMPLTGMLSDDDKNTIREWIDGGAPM